MTPTLIDGSKFKAVNSRDRDFSPGKIDVRKEHIEQAFSAPSTHWRPQTASGR